MLCGVTATLGSNPSATATAARPRWGRAALSCPSGVCPGRALSCPSALLFEVSQWFLSNVARNSPATASNIESWSLELQRLWPISKNDRVKLRATFGGVVTAVAFGYLYRPRAPLSGPAPLQARPFTGPAPSWALPLCISRDAAEAEPRRVPPLLRVCSRGGRATSAQASSRRMLSSSTSP